MAERTLKPTDPATESRPELVSITQRSADRSEAAVRRGKPRPSSTVGRYPRVPGRAWVQTRGDERRVALRALRADAKVRATPMSVARMSTSPKRSCDATRMPPAMRPAAGMRVNQPNMRRGVRAIQLYGPFLGQNRGT